MLLRSWLRGASRREARATSKCRCGWGNCAFSKTTFKERVHRVAAQITTTTTNVAVAEAFVRSARVAFCQLLQTAPFKTTFKHNLARTLVAAARGTQIFRWISGEEGFVSNLKTLPPDAPFPEPQRHYEVARSPRRARRRAREHIYNHLRSRVPTRGRRTYIHALCEQIPEQPW